MAKYRHLFFDLDRTLWDFDTNSRSALSALYTKHGLHALGLRSVSEFIQTYESINEGLWSEYREGKLHKQLLRRRRFTLTLAAYGLDDERLGQLLDEEYIATSPVQTALVSGAAAVLGSLQQRYELHIITNGFEEVQHLKLRSSGLRPYFRYVVTSESARARKPEKQIFELACRLAKASPETCLMIGDDLEADVLGARNAGIDQVYYNPARQPHAETITHEIRHLEELLRIL